jgi:hypothetical protein
MEQMNQVWYVHGPTACLLAPLGVKTVMKARMFSWIRGNQVPHVRHFSEHQKHSSHAAAQ